MARPIPKSHLRLVEPDGLDLYRSFEDQPFGDLLDEQPATRGEPCHVPFGEAAFMMLVAALVCALLAGGGW